MESKEGGAVTQDNCCDGKFVVRNMTFDCAVENLKKKYGLSTKKKFSERVLLDEDEKLEIRETAHEKSLQNAAINRKDFAKKFAPHRKQESHHKSSGGFRGLARTFSVRSQKNSIYDPIKSWTFLKHVINAALQVKDLCVNVSMNIGIHVFKELTQSNNIDCIDFVKTNKEVIIFTQTSCIAIRTRQFIVWTLKPSADDISHDKSRPMDVECKKQVFKVSHEFHQILYIQKFKIFAVACNNELKMRFYTDVNTGFVEFNVLDTHHTVTCLVFNSDTNQLLAGEFGCVQRWDLSEFSQTIRPLSNLNLEMDEIDQCIGLIVDKQEKLIHATMKGEISTYNYALDKQKFRHQVDFITAMVLFEHEMSYIILAHMDGSISIYSKTDFMILHRFVSQQQEITSLFVHPDKPLLFSSSIEGTIIIYRLDLFEEQYSFRIAEAIKGMRLMSAHEMCFWTSNTLHICQINIPHDLFNATKSQVLFLERLECPGYPDRVIVETLDGSIRIICPTTGKDICMTYPIPVLHNTQDITMDRMNDKLYALLNGEVLEFDCTMNPCLPLHIIKAEYSVAPISSIAHIFSTRCIDNATGPVQEEVLIFSGHADGTIRLLEGTHFCLPKYVRGHDGAIKCLTHSSGQPCNHNSVGTKDRLLSGGVDGCIAVWSIYLNNPYHDGEIALQVLQMVKTEKPPTFMAMVGYVLSFAVENSGAFFMVHLSGGGRSKQGVFVQTSDDHFKPINSISSCPSLQLFVTSGDDNVIKIWNDRGSVIRELVFDGKVHNVIFATVKGDLLLGYMEHVFSISVDDYLPRDTLAEILKREFEEPIIEDALGFDHSLLLQECNFLDLPVFPINISNRRKRIKYHKEYLNARKQIIKSEAKRQQVDRSKIDRFHSRVALTLNLSPRTPKLDRVSWTSDKEIPEAHFEGVPKTEALTNQLKFESTRANSPEDISKPRRGSISAAGMSSSGATSRSRRASKSKSELYMRPPVPSPPLTLSQEEIKRQVEEKRRKLEEYNRYREEQRRKYPIAPDGYVPNSVIRGILPWRRPSPNDLHHRRKKKKKKESVSDSEVNVAVESDDGSVKSLRLPTPTEDVDAKTDIRSPRRPKHRGRKGAKTPEPTFVEPEHQPESIVEKPKVEEEDDGLKGLHPLLREIIEQPWYKKNDTDESAKKKKKSGLSLEEIVNRILSILPSVDDPNTNKNIMDYLVKIHQLIGMPDKLTQKVINHLKERRRKKSDPIRLQVTNALKEFGVVFGGDYDSLGGVKLWTKKNYNDEKAALKILKKKQKVPTITEPVITVDDYDQDVVPEKPGIPGPQGSSKVSKVVKSPQTVHAAEAVVPKARGVKPVVRTKSIQEAKELLDSMETDADSIENVLKWVQSSPSKVTANR